PRSRLRRRELTTPEVTVGPPESPRGFPIARTGCPTLRRSESPNSAGFTPSPSTLITATSVSSSPPTTVPGRTRPSGNVTRIFSASWTTCWFVRMWPSWSITTPEPNPLRGHGPHRPCCGYGAPATPTFTVLAHARSTAFVYASWSSLIIAIQHRTMEGASFVVRVSGYRVKDHITTAFRDELCRIHFRG